MINTPAMRQLVATYVCIDVCMYGLIDKNVGIWTVTNGWVLLFSSTQIVGNLRTHSKKLPKRYVT